MPLIDLASCNRNGGRIMSDAWDQLADQLEEALLNNPDGHAAICASHRTSRNGSRPRRRMPSARQQGVGSCDDNPGDALGVYASREPRLKGKAAQLIRAKQPVEPDWLSSLQSVPYQRSRSGKVSRAKVATGVEE